MGGEFKGFLIIFLYFKNKEKDGNMLRFKLLKSAISIFILAFSICSTGDWTKLSLAHVSFAENMEDKHVKCVQRTAEIAIDVLIATRSVIAKNQELINRDPISGNYYFKGFVPAVVGSQVANDFSLMTGYKLKQTSLKLRNPANAPDEWEKKALEILQSSSGSKGVGFGEILETNEGEIYRYIKPIYAERACLDCHGEKDKVKPAIKQFLERKYPSDQAFGYKEGDLRGGISIIISLEH